MITIYLFISPTALSVYTSQNISDPSGACVEVDLTAAILAHLARSADGALPEAVLVQTAFCEHEEGGCRYVEVTTKLKGVFMLIIHILAHI